MIRRHAPLAAWILGAIVAALLFFLGGAALRLLMGPISLGPFAGAIEDALNRSVSGLVIRFDKAVLEWSRSDGRINLIVLGTKVFDIEGRIIAQAPKADLDFNAADLVAGRLNLTRFGLVGVQLAGVRTKEGALRLGFSSGEGAPDILETIRAALQSSAKTADEHALRSFSIRDARLAFSDEPSGLFIVSPDSTFTLENKDGYLNASLESAVEVSGVPARIEAKVVLREDGMPASGSLDVHGLSLPALAENSPLLAALRPYRLVSDFGVNFVLGENGELLSSAFRSGGVGVIENTALQGPLAIDKFDIRGSYDAASNHVALDTVDIQSKQLIAHAKADLVLNWVEHALSSISGEVTARDSKIAFPAWFHDTIAVSRLAMKVDYDRAQNTLAWQHVTLRAGQFSTDLSGTATFKDKGSPAVKLTGTLAALPVRELIKYWPANFARGAYRWIDENISDGRMGPARIAVDLPAGLSDGERLSDEALSISFPFEGATIHYLGDLTPVTGGRGDAVLRGNSFKATVADGHIGPIAVKNSGIVLPDIQNMGAIGYVTAHGEGKVADVLALIDLKPLGYPTRFGFDAKRTGGNATLDLNVSIPMRREVSVEEIGIGVQAHVREATVPIDGRRTLEHADARIDIDANSLISHGTGTISGVPTTFTWTESFASFGDSTRVDVSAVLDEKSRADLGLFQPPWVTGKMPTSVTFTGRQFRLADAIFKTDLTDAAADVKIVNIQKRAGVPASMAASVHFIEGGGMSVTDLDVTGQDLHVHGGMQLNSDAELTEVSLSEVRDGGDNDFAVAAEAIANGGFEVQIQGKSLDATALFGGIKPGHEKNKPVPEDSEAGLHNPLSVTANLDKLVFRDDFAFREVSFAVAFGADERLDGFSLSATGPGQGQVTGSFSTANGGRSVKLDADDAGAFIRTVTGFSSIKRGNLEARISFPPDRLVKIGAALGPPRYAGTIVLSNVLVTDQPFMARLFAAGSLDGPLRLLKGEGIQVTKFDAPFTMRGNVMTVRDGRFSGPAVGATFEGTLDRSSDHVDVTGTLVPVYGINSMLGGVPLLGDLLVSKKGEGIFGLTYAMRGDLEEPGIMVNPLSVLTPGIFRRIFEFVPKEPVQAANVPPSPGKSE